MTITKERMTCECGHVFEAQMVTDAPISVAVASMKAIFCPKCGSHRVGLGGAYNDSPGPGSSIAERAGWWFDRGETGTSSLTIYCAMTGTSRSPHRDFCYPLDPDDYRRCKLLLDLIPEWRAELSRVCNRFPWFKPFSDRWDRFDELWAQESPSKRCPKLYDLMQVARKEADAIRLKRAGA